MFDDSAIVEAAAAIVAGQCVAVPTETVYGLAADATNAAAVARIYAAKGRPEFNPLIVHVPDLEVAQRYGVFDAQALALAVQHWPGPLTIVVPLRAGAGIASLVTAGLHTIALRVPRHRAMRALLSASDRPLAAPSANASGTVSPTRASHVARTLAGRIALIVDDGACEIGLESTIVACDEGVCRQLRAGPVLLGDASVALSDSIEAPGQLPSHYAPSKPMRLDADSATADEFMIGFGGIGGDVNLSQAGDCDEAAANLFDSLHLADLSTGRRIAVATIPRYGIGIAINDRLQRAAH